MSPIALLQNSLEDLAGAALRQLGRRELDVARNLVIGERLAAKSDQFIRRENLSRLQHEASHYECASPGIRYSEDRDFTNRSMLVNDRFDFTGVDIFAAREDHVLQSVQAVAIPIWVLISNVPSAKHPS
jgi:hypothetical protein